MNALIVAAVLAAPNLEKQDWSSDDGTKFLALRQLEEDSDAVAWLIEKHERRYVAFCGPYAYTRRNGTRILRIGFNRKWESAADRDGNLWWSLDSTYSYRELDRYGVELEVNEARNGATLSVVDAFFVDGQGNSTGEEALAFDTDEHFERGQILTFSGGKAPPRIKDQPPPGFVPRSTWVRRAKKKPDTVFNTDILKKDLMGWCTPAYTTARELMVLQLRRSKDHWYKGKAWIIYLVQRKGKYALAAGRGRFAFYSERFDKQDAYVMQLSMPRTYEAQLDDGSLRWSVASDDSTTLPPSGLSFHVPLADRRFSRHAQTMVADSFFFVDQNGQKKREYFRSGPLGIFREEYVPTEMGSVHRGDTFTFHTPGSPPSSDELQREERKLLKLIDDAPPPGFGFREAITRTVAKIPAKTETDAAEDKIDTVWKKAWEADADGDYDDAMSGYKAVIQKSTEFAPAYNALAWLHATCPDASFRDGEKAVELAEKAAELSDYEEPYILDTLAAAYAETGDFKRAVAWQQKALELVPKDDRAQYLEHLVLFLKKQPVREE